MLAVTVPQASTVIAAAAGRICVRLVEHSVILADATGSMGDAEPQDFNREYRRRRIAVRGQPFSHYNAALARWPARSHRAS
jgi:hypothetical protein